MHTPLIQNNYANFQRDKNKHYKETILKTTTYNALWKKSTKIQTKYTVLYRYEKNRDRSLLLKTGWWAIFRCKFLKRGTLEFAANQSEGLKF